MCGISELSSATSCTRPTTLDVLRVFGSGIQNAVWIDPVGLRLTLSANPKAWNISIVRVLMLSALLLMMLPDMRSTIIVSMAGNCDNGCGQTETGWAGARDQHIHLFRQRLIATAISPVGRSLPNVRDYRPETIFL